MILRPPTPTLFPYTTLFRSLGLRRVIGEVLERLHVLAPVADVRERHEAAVQHLGVRVVQLDDGVEDRRSEEHTSELQSRLHLVCRLLLEKKKKKQRAM